MDLKLKVSRGKNVGREVPIPGNKFLIGRSEDCHLRPGSDMISRHHCVIMVETGSVVVRDFGSKNGTFVNDQPVVGECELKMGDLLRVGPLEFEVCLTQGNLSGKKKPPVLDTKDAASRTAGAGIADDDTADEDISEWLSSGVMPLADVIATTDTQTVRLSDTDSIDMGSTQEISLVTAPSAEASSKSPAPAKSPAAKQSPVTIVKATAVSKPAVAPKPAAVSQPAAVPKPAAASQPAAAPKPAAAPQPAAVPKPQALPQPVAVSQESLVPQPVASAPENKVPDPAGKKGLFGGGKKTFGKLPEAAKQAPKDSRDAAADMLNRFRKRR